MKRYIEVDLLRILGFLLVLAYHLKVIYTQNTHAGFLGVDIFFVIAGFLSGNLYDPEKIGWAQRYLVIRARRLLPAYFATILITFLIGVLFFYGSTNLIHSLQEYVLASTFFVTNITANEADYFSLAADYIPLLHFWSMSLEISFFILYSLLFFIKENRLQLIYLLTTASLIYFIAVESFYYDLFARMFEFLSGLVVAWNKEKLSRYMQRLTDSIRQIMALALMAVLAILGFVVIQDEVHKYWHPVFVSITLAVLIISPLRRKSYASLGLSFNSLIVKFSDRTYSLFLLHYPVFVFVNYFIGFKNFLSLTVGISTLFIISEPFYRFFDRFSDFKKYFTRLLFISLALVFTILAKSHFLQVNHIDRLFFETPQQEFKDFVRLKANSHRLRPFDLSSQKPKVLLLGDSFSQDLFNIISSSDFAGQSTDNISTYVLPQECTALFSKKQWKSLENRLVKKCETYRIYRHKRLLSLVSQADYVLFASRYTPWFMDHAKEARDFLKSYMRPTAKIFFVTEKSLGIESLGKLKSIKLQQRSYYLSEADKRATTHNNKLEKIIQKSEILDLYACSCVNDKCRPFDNKGHWLSYDGYHLTKDGAKFLAKCEIFSNLF